MDNPLTNSSKNFSEVAVGHIWKEKGGERWLRAGDLYLVLKSEKLILLLDRVNDLKGGKDFFFDPKSPFFLVLTEQGNTQWWHHEHIKSKCRLIARLDGEHEPDEG